jgi:hypothetical protein
MSHRPVDFPFTIMDIASLLRLNIRRRGAGHVYVDCPVCGDRRGKMNLNLTKNVWHCNYCGEGGGMLALYGKVHGLSNKDAYREICDALQTGTSGPNYVPAHKKEVPKEQEIAQSERAPTQDIHKTLSALLSMLTLTDAHRKHLQKKRGLTDEQITQFGFKSTPPPRLCRPITEQLLKQGYTVQGVPGFYVDDNGRWTVKFHQRTAGIIIPLYGVDGLLHGLQIRLDHPIKDEADPPEKSGTKYLPLTSSNKNQGTTSGSPIHFIGSPLSRVVYVTEGALKADIAHALTGRTFVAIAGANNTAGLDDLFSFLRRNGTEEIIEAADMDKYSNQMVHKGATKIFQLAAKYGMSCRRLTWNPNYKGIDDWQLALHRKKERHKEAQNMNLEQREHRFQVFQLDLDKGKTYPFAFRDIKTMRKEGYQQPPAEFYRLVYDGTIYCAADMTVEAVLEQIFCRCNDDFPEGYQGHSLSMSDVVGLYEDDLGAFFYCSQIGFTPVQFSAELAKPMRNSNEHP